MTYSPTGVPKLADEHKALAYEAYQAVQPGFRAPEGSPTVSVLEAVGQLGAELAVGLDLSAEALTLREAQLRGLDRYAAVAATLSSTWTATGTQTIDSGSAVTVTDSSGVETQWLVPEAVTFTTTTTFDLVAANAGVGSNDVSGTAVAVQPKYAWLTSLTVSGPSSGGVDEEAYPDFLDRVGREFIVGSQLIVKADQLAAKVVGLPGVGIALAIRTYNPTGPDPAAPGHMTVAVADVDREDYPGIHATIEALPTADCNEIHAVDFDRHPVKITASVLKHDDWPDPSVVKQQSEDALYAWVQSWGQRQQGEAQIASVEDTVLLDQVAAILNNQMGVKRVTPYADVKIGVDGGAITHSDKALTGDFPLAYVAVQATDIVVTVS